MAQSVSKILYKVFVIPFKDLGEINKNANVTWSNVIDSMIDSGNITTTTFFDVVGMNLYEPTQGKSYMEAHSTISDNVHGKDSSMQSDVMTG